MERLMIEKHVNIANALVDEDSDDNADVVAKELEKECLRQLLEDLEYRYTDVPSASTIAASVLLEYLHRRLQHPPVA